jgi:hypothetical protein
MSWTLVKAATRFSRRVLESLLIRWKLLETRSIRHRLAILVLQLDRRGFVFISNNCIAGQLYEMAGLEKRSPTAGLFFRNGAYRDFLKDLATGKTASWSHVSPDTLRVDLMLRCPIWDHGADNDIVFLHYPDPSVASRKWNSRFPRMQGRKPIVIATLHGGVNGDQMLEVKPRFEHFAIMETSRSRIDNDGLDRCYLGRLHLFLEAVLTKVREVD